MIPLKKSSLSQAVFSWSAANMVPILFLLFTLFGFYVSEGVPLVFFLRELSSRFFRNIFLVLSLIIPVIAGLGLNFGIVIGAMAAQVAIAVVKYFSLGGLWGLILCVALSVPLALLFGRMTGHLYNKTRGQEMIASLIVGFFANAAYQFAFLYFVGGLIKVPANHPMIKPDGVGIRATIDMGKPDEGGLQYAVDGICKIPLMWGLLIVSLSVLVWLAWYYHKVNKNAAFREKIWPLRIKMLLAAAASILFGCVLTSESLLLGIKIPVVTAMAILLLCLFTEWITGTKLGQDFRSVGSSQHIAQVSGIDIDKKRILAVEISTVLAALGQIIFLQDIGTFNTYSAHEQIGMFSVAALLVGGASISNATIWHAIIGTILFNAMFIISPEIGQAVFGQVLLGEYFRTFVVYGVIGLALGIYVWKINRRKSRVLN